MVMVDRREGIFIQFICFVDKYAGKNDKAIKKIILKHDNGICQELANCIIQKIVNNSELFSEIVLKEYLVLLDRLLTDP